MMKTIMRKWLPSVFPPQRISPAFVVKGVGIEHLGQKEAILAIMGVITLVLAASRVIKSLA